MRETLFTEDFLVIDYLHDLNILMSNWYGHLDYESGIIGYNRVKEAIKRNQVDALLSDMSKIQSATKDIQHYILEQQHYPFANMGLRFHAIVLPIQWIEKVNEKMSILSANDGKRLEVACFDSARVAGAWLKMRVENTLMIA
jgi:hypothetical protein